MLLICCAGGVVAESGMSLYLTYSSLVNAYLSNNLKDTIAQLVKMLSVHGQSVRQLCIPLTFHGGMGSVLASFFFSSFSLLSQWLPSCRLPSLSF